MRKLARLPAVAISFGYSFDSAEGLATLGETNDPAGEIESLRHALTGGPDDAERYFRLSQLYSGSGPAGQNAGEALTNSIKLFRQRVALQPENGRLLADFGAALELSDDGATEAEHVLRNAVRVAPEDWHCRTALGNYLLGQSLTQLCGRENADWSSPDRIVDLVVSNKPSPARIEAAQAAVREGMDCMNKAVSLAPNEAEVYKKRASSRPPEYIMHEMLKLARGEPVDSTRLKWAFLTGGAKDDFRKIGELEPKNFRAIAMLVICEIGDSLLSSPKPSDLNFREVWNRMPDAMQASIRKDMVTLQKLDDDPDKKIAVGALQADATLQLLVVGDSDASIKNLRRALDLDPGNDLITEQLIGLYGQSGKFTEILPVAEERAKRHETPRNLLLVAKVLDNLDRPEEAEKVMKRAVEIAPDDFNSQIGLTALLIRHPGKDALEAAAVPLRAAHDILQKIPEADRTDDQKTDFLVTYGLCLGLNDETDRAREAFNTILAHDPENQTAKDALAALGH